MKIAITNRQRRRKIRSSVLKKVAKTILNALGYPTSELSVAIVGDRSIRRLNRQYLGRDKPTNVLAFAMQEGPFPGINPGMLGDVVISVDTCASEADVAGLSFDARLTFLLLHGILHLTGYDHEQDDPVETGLMEAKELELFALLEDEGFV